MSASTRLAAFTLLLAPTVLPAAVSSLHPRIFVRNDAARLGNGLTVSQLRARLNQPPYARWRARASEGVVENAARYLETADPAALAAARDFLLTRTFSYEKNDVGGFLAGAEMATAFDWVYAGLSPSDRAAAMANIVTTTDSSFRFLHRGGPDINHNYTYMALATVAVCGLALHGEAAPYGARAEEYLETAREFIESPGKVIDTWNAREGAWAEGSHYTFHETLRNLVLMLQAYRTASDTDYFHRIDMAKAGRFLIGCTRPDLTFERTGDTSANRVQLTLTVPVTVQMLAAGVPAADEAARLRSFSDALVETYGDNPVHPRFAWGMRIFEDTSAPRTPSYRTLPLAMRMGAGTYDQIVFRNGWGPESSMVTILAGDHYTDHQHFDKGQFLLYRGGALAVDSGAYDGMYGSGKHSSDYAPRTLAHNCLLVYDPAETFPKGYANDGGQIVLRNLQHHATWPMFLEHKARERLDSAEVEAYDTAAAYNYVRVNLKGAYSEKVTRYDRQFVYLPGPDVLAVFDRVTSSSPDFEKRWLLHFQERPEIDGAAPEPGIRAFPGARVTAERRQDGALFVETLLPEDRTITAVGGPGYEFYNLFNKTNYPVSRPAVAAEPRESGTWRIEVSPRRPAQTDTFLHALQLAARTAEPVATKLITGPGIAGVHFLSPRQNEVIVFTAGAPRLSYSISSDAPAVHTVVELPPNLSVAIEVNGKRLRTARVNSQGVLSFRDGALKTRTIAIGSVRHPN